MRLWLYNRLNDKLRFGEDKSTYGVRVFLAKNRKAGYFGLGGSLDPGQVNHAKAVIDAEIRALRGQSLSAVSFETEKQAIINNLKVETQPDRGLMRYALHHFHTPGRHHEFPNLPEIFGGYTQASLSTAVNNLFDEEMRVDHTTRPHPFSSLQMTVVGMIFFFLVRRAVAKRMTSRLPMKKIRYLAKFQATFVDFCTMNAMPILGFLVSIWLLVLASKWIQFLFIRHLPGYPPKALFSFLFWRVASCSFITFSRAHQKLCWFSRIASPSSTGPIAPYPTLGMKSRRW